MNLIVQKLTALEVIYKRETLDNERVTKRITDKRG